MTDRGWDDDDTRPYFFLSYAHTPKAGARGAGDPNHWVRQLYRDLCEAVLQITTAPDGVPVGFMDESMHQGELWAERLSDELASCRVFVPLYSPRYFNSVPCGQEWHAFTRRPVYPANLDSERTSGIVPVLWAPMSRYRLPKVATELQFNHASFGPDYATEGLYALMKLSYFRSAYELAVHRLAARIVQVAEETVIPVGRRLEFNGLPSAFNVTAPTKQLRISVLAYHQGELPADRNPDYYGDRRTDWHPYRPVGSPIAQHAVRLARQLGFQPTVHEFDDEAESIIGGAAEAPGLLLLDRWALRDPRRRELVRRFDRSDTTWVSVLEPWNTDDPECEERAGEMGELSDDALRITRRAGRPSFLGVTGPTGLRTLEDFDDALPRAAMKAKYAFEGRTRAEPEEPPPPRPSLRDAFRRSGGGAGGGGNGNDRDDSHSNGHDGNGRSNGHDGNGRSNGHDRDNHHDPYREHDPYRDDGDDPDDGMAPLGGRGNR
ncbi:MULTISPECIES: TIR-like protein FxsC [Streptomyces]|uniref:TIR-like protein FxsC n=1 Tax=Streptomyces TaxID=1883 RepID=UPI00068F6565|nr:MULTISPECIES: TIR-like protein FxsC [Streptomyces]